MTPDGKFIHMSENVIVAYAHTWCFRDEVYSLFLHLHNADFVHNSPFVRNILVQPGPLTRPPSQRSIKTPSFRLIDFGRVERLEDFRVKASSKVEGDRKFCFACQEENSRVTEALGGPFP